MNTPTRLLTTLLCLAALASPLASGPARAAAQDIVQATHLPDACVVLLHEGKSRVRCVVSADRAMQKQPANLGAPVIWDRIIADPATLQAVKPHVA